MKEKVNLADCAARIYEALPKGILLNTNGEKFNSMVIGWGHLGHVWSIPTFIVYVRQGRYTKPQLDRTREFTISVPLGDPDPEINRILGLQSGWNIDKAKEAPITLEEPEIIRTPGIREYPLTLECSVLYAQDQVLSLIPEDIRRAKYPQDVDGTAPIANRDFHTTYIGRIEAAYIIR